MRKKLYGYARVSTKKQLEGKSLEVQIERIKKYCDFNNYELMHIYKDRGVSSFKDRPKFETMLKNINNVDGVIVNDITRFGRSTTDLLLQIQDLDRIGKIFISIKDNIDISTKNGKLMLTLLSAIAEYEATTIRERMQAGREYALKYGTKKFGRPKIEIDFDLIKDRRSHGYSFTRIANEVGVSVPTLIDRSRKEGIE